MLRQSFLLLPALIAGGLLLTGAWTGHSAPPARTAPTPFVPQLFALQDDLGGPDVTALQLLNRAIQNLATDHVSWLKTKIQQNMTDCESTFVSSGFLQRGPNGCVRFELQVLTAGVPSRLLIVSDGELLAEERRIHNAAPVIVCNSFETADEARPVDRAAREAYLARKGCAGPIWILQQLPTALQKLQYRTGLLDNAPVIEIKGETVAPGGAPFATTTVPVCQVRLYLDAKTLWPRCIEYWGKGNSALPSRLVQIEFRDAEINQALTLEECSRTFSYQPDQAIADKPH